MLWTWFERYWSSVGLGAAVVLLILLSCTNLLRHDLTRSRWRDPVWLAWALAVAYMLHNFEEYGIDLFGRPFHFPTTACQTFGFTDIATCPLTPAFFVAVNIPVVWIAFVAAALLARRFPAVGLTGMGVQIFNAPSHIATLFTPMGYSPGALTAVFIFLPLSIWILATQIGRSKVRIQSLIAILLTSVTVQGLLLVLLSGLSQSAIGEVPAIVIQTLAAGFLVVIPWIAEKRWPSGPHALAPSRPPLPTATAPS